MNYEAVAKRIEIATRTLLLFTVEEINSKGMADRKKITDVYNEIKEGTESYEDSLKEARIIILTEILKEECKNGVQNGSGGESEPSRGESEDTRRETREAGEKGEDKTNS